MISSPLPIFELVSLAPVSYTHLDGGIEPVVYPDPIRLKSLKGYEAARKTVIDNTLALLNGLSANNCLLYGDRGTGKSSTVKAILNEYAPQGLRMVEMPKDQLCDFPKLVERIAALPLRFIIFIDDLSFTQQDDTYAALKAVLEGGLAAQPENALIYATSNPVSYTHLKGSEKILI